MVLYKIAVLAATIMDGDGKQMKTSPVVLKTVQQCDSSCSRLSGSHIVFHRPSCCDRRLKSV